MYILGISAYYHDSGVALIKNGEILAAAQEERFTRKKQDANFPSNAINYCLTEAGINLEEVDSIAFYDKPFLKFERLLETYLSEAPKGFNSFIRSIPIWLKDKLYLKETLAREFESLYRQSNISLSNKKVKKFKKDILEKLLFGEHHQSHAASAFYPSPFQESAILTVDGVGEWATTSISYGKDNKIEFVKEINFPHSLGLLYSAFTYYTGFKVNSGEYKVMGLAPYGQPKYVDLIKDHLIDIKSDGSFKLDMSYFNYTTGLTMTSNKFHKLFGGEPRVSESEISQREMDLAASIQAVTEEVMLKLAKHALDITQSKNLCLAGGVALNCVSNGKLLKNLDANIWIQPAAGDAGGALGGAMSAYYQEFSNDRVAQANDSMKGAYLGPSFNPDEIKQALDKAGANYTYYEEEVLLDIVSKELANQKVIGWHSGRMEYGPRSLGARSIIGDPRMPSMQSKMNLKIKFRESFRPFAPSVLEEHVSDWFELDTHSPYMLLVAPVKDSKRIKMSEQQEALFGVEKINIARSEIPAVTHVDYSARVQTVNKNRNPRYHRLLEKFYEITDCPVLVNTSFNVRGEPVVCTPEDSYRCFMRTEMDLLVIDGFILRKEDQEDLVENKDWMKEFELD
ncbi:carbamoyltransferase [Bacterioplanoides sp. SCSIO 12839]|uniref:carbamoyltransferase family protein n=1 Tax=Bacterioplanoides sp. SCSIO 12839 TaxID=2829569 RepID=UPI0021082B66|nr:carbamoyltransferase [Bacterioplanoides sp. SCSIO 12839]UTW49495.1 carbamoyltransferase [Bacterioplanoides sp. SCSIO 12839]